MIILGIETTCDETGASVVEGDPKSSLGLKVLSNVVASSFDLQKKYGGVVPEVAAREQVRSILPVIAEAIANAAQTRNSKLETRNNLINPKISKWAKENINAIAVAYGPGLIGSLLIGVETAKTLALAWNKPLIPVNHLVGHIYANWLALTVNGKWKMVNEKREKSIAYLPLTIHFPLIALIVSGGHTDLVLMRDHAKFDLLGSTLDDAAGEAFDKVARVLGMGYPGGPEIEKLASRVQGLGSSIKLPRPMINSNDFDFSFSGLKTAVVNRVRGIELRDQNKSGLAAEFQKAVVDVLVKKTMKAAEKFGAKAIIIGGGVAANELLRSQMTTQSSRTGIIVLFPSKKLSVDNGAMIAAAAFYNFKKVDPLNLSADPSLHF